MKTYRYPRDGDYPAGVTSSDPHFDMPSVGDPAEARRQRIQLHCEHNWMPGVQFFPGEIFCYRRCTRCQKVMDEQMIPTEDER